MVFWLESVLALQAVNRTKIGRKKANPVFNTLVFLIPFFTAGSFLFIYGE